MRVQETVVIAKHCKNHRQREIRVVHTALLAAFAMNGQSHGIVFFARSHGRNHFALTRNDPHKHIGTHGRGNHGTHQQEGCATCKQLAGQPSRKGDNAQHQTCNDQLTILFEAEQSAHGVIDKPKRHQETQGR